MALTTSQIQSIEEVRRYIDLESLTRFTIKHLTERSGLTKDLLTEGFKELFQETIYQYQVRIAMEAAKIKLQNGRTVKSLSIELKYSTPASFARAFYRELGILPSVFKTEKVLH